MIELLFFFILFIVLLVCWANYSGAKENKKFQVEYAEFLGENEGLEVFCYTNRELFCDVVEKEILPTLDEAISVIKLVGKEPDTKLDKRFITYSLNRLKNVGFPNVMRIVDGRFLDISMHNEIYNGINNGKSNELPALVQLNIDKLRGLGEHKT